MKALTLLEVVARLSAYDDQSTIYAIEPWRCESPVAVRASQKKAGRPPRVPGAALSTFWKCPLQTTFCKGGLNTSGGPFPFASNASA